MASLLPIGYNDEPDDVQPVTCEVAVVVASISPSQGARFSDESGIVLVASLLSWRPPRFMVRNQFVSNLSTFSPFVSSMMNNCV